MKHDLSELLAIIHHHYPHGTGATPHKQSQEQTRLIAARQREALDKRWPALLARISERSPGRLTNQCLNIAAGSSDACYSFTIASPHAGQNRPLWFSISFLAPYYAVYGLRWIETAARIEGLNTTVHGVQFYIPQGALGSEFISSLDGETMKSAILRREVIDFDLSADEQLYAAPMMGDIEAIFGYERMPPDIGAVLVPDVTTALRLGGEARLFDCLFTDRHAWENSVGSPETVRLDIEADRLPEAVFKGLTVLAAFYTIGLALAPPELQHAYFRASADGVLRKEEMLQALDRMRATSESPEALEAMKAGRELRALLMGWNGEGGPPDGMLGWAKGWLKNNTRS